MRDLHEIAAECGTDKLKLGYIKHYQECFEPIANAITYFANLSHKVVSGEIASIYFVNQMVFIKKGE